MRYTSSYCDGIQSVDRNHSIRVVFRTEKPDDNDDVEFISQGTNISDEEFICYCKMAVWPYVFEMVSGSIQDDKSLTKTQLFYAIKQLSRVCTSLWDKSKYDPKIADNI